MDSEFVAQHIVGQDLLELVCCAGSSFAFVRVCSFTKHPAD